MAEEKAFEPHNGIIRPSSDARLRDRG